MVTPYSSCDLQKLSQAEVRGYCLLQLLAFHVCISFTASLSGRRSCRWLKSFPAACVSSYSNNLFATEMPDGGVFENSATALWPRCETCKWASEWWLVFKAQFGNWLFLQCSPEAFGQRSRPPPPPTVAPAGSGGFTVIWQKSVVAES